MPNRLRLSTFLLSALIPSLPAPAQDSAMGRTVVLTYHDMVPKRDARSLWFDCTPAELRGQLDFMEKSGCHFISLDQLYEHLTDRKKLPAKPVAITFADNYQGFWDLAYPILKARRIPVAMFVHTGFVGDKTPGHRPKMNWDELRALDKDGLVTIGSQTVSHPPDIGKLPSAAQKRELTRSKEDLEAHLGHKVNYLAYPNGKFSIETERLAPRAGYTMAFSEVTKLAELSPGIFAVNRYVHTKYRQAIADLSERKRAGKR